MSYNIDYFLKPITPNNRNIQILDNMGVIKYTVNPFSIINTMVLNNVVKINLKNDKFILLNFNNSEEAKSAIVQLQSQIDTLTDKVPIVIEKAVENWVNDQFIVGTISFSNVVDSPWYIDGGAVKSDDLVIVDDNLEVNQNLEVAGGLYVQNQTNLIGTVSIGNDILKDGESIINRYHGTSSTPLQIPDSGFVVEMVTNRNLRLNPLQNVLVLSNGATSGYVWEYLDDDYVSDNVPNYFIGTVESYYPSSGTLSLVVTKSYGFGLTISGNIIPTFSNWQLSLTGKEIGSRIDPQGSSLYIDGHLLPGTNSLYNLGSPDFEWHTLYVGSQSLVIGGVTLSSDNDALLVRRINLGTIQNPVILTATGNNLLINGTQIAVGGGTGNGAQGPVGPQGSTGPDGIDGSDGAISGRWYYNSTATSPSNPSSTYFGTDVSNLANVDKISISKHIYNSTDYSTLFIGLDLAESSGRTVTVQITKVGDNSVLGLYSIGSTSTQSWGVDFDVSLILVGTGSLQNGQLYSISFDTTGPQGSQGPQGFIGSSGPQGDKGSSGSQGPTGPQGAQGSQGDYGPVGAAGLIWQGLWTSSVTYSINDAVGFASASWFCFATVSTVPGPTPSYESSSWALIADRGFPGDQGPQGPQGFQGINGPTGFPGVTGSNGATGPQGPIGPTGANGSSGVQGPTGPSGASGTQGPTGPVGATGSGTQGPTGPTGLSGSQGPTGPQGATGPSITSITFSNDTLSIRLTTVTFSTTINSFATLSAGNVTVTSFGGSTNRVVEATTVGFLTASRSIYTTYITDLTAQSQIVDPNNWTNLGVWIGSTVSNVYAGQRHYDANYLYEAITGNGSTASFIRLIRG